MCCAWTVTTAAQGQYRPPARQAYFELMRHDDLQHLSRWTRFTKLACPAVGPLSVRPSANDENQRAQRANMPDWQAPRQRSSTSEVYGDPEIHPQTELQGRVNPIGPQLLRRQALRRNAVADYHRQHSLAIKVRIFNTYARVHVNDGRVVSNFSSRPCAAKTSPFMATASRRAAFATSTT